MRRVLPSRRSALAAGPKPAEGFSLLVDAERHFMAPNVARRALRAPAGAGGVDLP
jgi:hypothetical protein